MLQPARQRNSSIVIRRVYNEAHQMSGKEHCRTTIDCGKAQPDISVIQSGSLIERRVTCFHWVGKDCKASPSTMSLLLLAIIAPVLFHSWAVISCLFQYLKFWYNHMRPGGPAAFTLWRQSCFQALSFSCGGHPKSGSSPRFHPLSEISRQTPYPIDLNLLLVG